MARRRDPAKLMFHQGHPKKNPPIRPIGGFGVSWALKGEEGGTPKSRFCTIEGMRAQHIVSGEVDVPVRPPCLFGGVNVCLQVVVARVGARVFFARCLARVFLNVGGLRFARVLFARVLKSQIAAKGVRLSVWRRYGVAG